MKLVGCLEPHFWNKFVKTLGLNDLASGNCAFAKGKHKDEIMKKIEQVLSTKTASQV